MRKDVAVMFGPQWQEIVALVRSIASITEQQTEDILVAQSAARYAERREARRAAWGAAWEAERIETWEAARYVAWKAAKRSALYAARDAAIDAAREEARNATLALTTRDLVGQNNYTQAHYELLSGPWQQVMGPLHPEDEAV